MMLNKEFSRSILQLVSTVGSSIWRYLVLVLSGIVLVEGPIRLEALIKNFEKLNPELKQTLKFGTQ